jgi:pyruvate dehydrogenase E1 component beta subunit/2-oxoisovalerate dehydrogenase E1 component beta subunit
VEDAYWMLLDSVQLDDPVIFCEHKFLYYHLKADDLPIEPVLSVGQARVLKPGRHATVVTHSAMVHESLKAANELAGEGWDIEVVDLRTVKPLDTDTVLGSVARTGRLLCVGEGFPWGGVTAEVVSRVVQDGFHLLDAPPQRLNCRDTPIPYHPNLWKAHRPTSQSIAESLRHLLHL